MMANSKSIVSGNHVSILVYKIPMLFGYKKPKTTRVKLTDPTKIAENRKKSLQRSRSYVINLINSNNYYWKNALRDKYNPEFITLTFRENVQDLNFANREFSKFIQRLNYFINKNIKGTLKYIGVVEFQERGSIHYHILFFNLPFIKMVYDELRKLWTHGSINLKSVNQVKHIANYVCKYMIKGFEDTRLRNHKSYFTSRNLIKPRVSRDDSYNSGLVLFLPKKYITFDKIIATEYLDEIQYIKYELPYDDPLLPKIQ